MSGGGGGGGSRVFRGPPCPAGAPRRSWAHLRLACLPSPQVLLRSLLECRLAGRRAEDVRLPLILELHRGLFLVHLHPADRILCHGSPPPRRCGVPLIPLGPLPTGIVATTFSSVTSMTETEFA